MASPASDYQLGATLGQKKLKPKVRSLFSKMCVCMHVHCIRGILKNVVTAIFKIVLLWKQVIATWLWFNYCSIICWTHVSYVVIVVCFSFMCFLCLCVLRACFWAHSSWFVNSDYVCWLCFCCWFFLCMCMPRATCGSLLLDLFWIALGWSFNWICYNFSAVLADHPKFLSSQILHGKRLFGILLRAFRELLYSYVADCPFSKDKQNWKCCARFRARFMNIRSHSVILLRIVRHWTRLGNIGVSFGIGG